jgi:hypothetical protein
MHRRIAFALSAAVLLAPGAAQAQDCSTSDGLACLLLRFFSESNPVVLQQAPEPFNHSAHFVSQPEARATLTELNRSIATQLSTFPITSSSGGFTFTFDPALGVFNRSTETFGPVFSERPLTSGKGKFSVGVTHTISTYDKFEGNDLRDGEMKLYLTHLDTNNDHTSLAPWFEGDVIESDLFIELENDTTVLFANYGVTDRFDVGVAIPYLKVDLNARIATGIQRLATGADPFIIHQFNDGTTTRDFVESGNAEGVGDVLVRGKYSLVAKPGAGLAAAVDVRLPTGDDEDLLGSGGTQTKVFLIGALRPSRRFAPRATAGYVFSSGGSDLIGDLPNEIDYSAGFDAGLHSRVTLTADFLGRTILDATRVELQNRVLVNSLRTNPAARIETQVTTPVPTTGNLNLWLGSVGVKVNPVGRLLLVGNVLFALGNDGLQDEVTPVFGIDYTF